MFLDDWVFEKKPYLFIVWRKPNDGKIGRIINMVSANPNDSRELYQNNKDDIALCESIKNKVNAINPIKEPILRRRKL